MPLRLRMVVPRPPPRRLVLASARLDRPMNARLCALPGCRQRNRHLPTCTDDCLGCLPRLAEDGIVCDQHVRWAAESLAEIIALTDDARAVAAGLVRHGSGGGGKPGSRSPGNDDAMDALDAVQGALTTMARAIADERGLTFGTDGRSRPLRTSVTAQRAKLVPVSTPEAQEA
jgi:hypothetical protein